jgi:hypothetical protein
MRELVARLVIAWLLIAAIGFILANASEAHGRTPIGLLRALESLPVYHLDRGPEHAQLKAQQMQEASAAIREFAKGDKDLEAMLITVGWHESNWSLAIMNGHCPPKMCDPDKNGVPRAHSNYQLHRVAVTTREAWEEARTDLRVATREASFVLQRMRTMCRSKNVEPVRRTLAAYGSGSCSGKLPDIERRMATFRSVRSKL